MKGCVLVTREEILPDCNQWWSSRVGKPSAHCKRGE